MAYAMLDDENRIVEFSEDPLEGMNTEFDNADFVNETESQSLRDFVVVNRMAIYQPTQESIRILEDKKAKEDYAQLLMAICDSIEVPVKPREREGYNIVPVYEHSTNSISWDYREQQND